MSSRSKNLPSIEAKVVVLGTQGVGKTSLVLRHVGNTFSRSLWDTAGQERFRSMAPMYYRRANAAMIVYDITRDKSFQEAQEWVKELESKVEGKIALVLIGNKCDLTDEREVARDRGEEFAHQIGAMFTETSASENTGVKEAFLKVAQGMITFYNKSQLVPPSPFGASFSPVNSYSRSPAPSLPKKRDNAYYNPLAATSMESNGRVVVGDGSVASQRQGEGPLQRCCNS